MKGIQRFLDLDFIQFNFCASAQKQLRPARWLLHPEGDEATLVVRLQTEFDCLDGIHLVWNRLAF